MQVFLEVDGDSILCPESLYASEHLDVFMFVLDACGVSFPWSWTFGTSYSRVLLDHGALFRVCPRETTFTNLLLLQDLKLHLHDQGSQGRASLMDDASLV